MENRNGKQEEVILRWTIRSAYWVKCLNWHFNFMGGLNRYPIPPNCLLNLSWQRRDGRDVGLRLSTPRATPLSAMVGLYNVGSNLEPKSYVATVITKD